MNTINAVLIQLASHRFQNLLSTLHLPKRQAYTFPHVSH